MGIAEKMSLLLLKHSLCRLNIIQDRMFVGGENFLGLTEWQSFKNTGRYTEISTSFFLLNNELTSSFNSEFNKWTNSSALLASLAAQDQ